MKTYIDFYRHHGVRLISHLQAPPFSKLETLELPRGSIFHFISENPLVVGPSADEDLFKTITRPILMSHITENGDNKGAPRKLPISAEQLIKNYHVKNRRYRRMISLDSVMRDENTLVVYNYGFIPQEYRYVRSIYAKYYEWWNIQSAVWKNINALAETTDRQHFIVCKIPNVLPGRSQLISATNHIDQVAMKNFNSPESLTILELWKWFGEEESESVFNNLSEKAADKTNIIFIDSGKWFCFNLGLIQSWRSATKQEMAEEEDYAVKGYKPSEMQKIILRMFMAVTVARGEIVDETNTEVVSTVIATSPDAKKITSTTVTPIAATITQPNDTINEVVKDSSFMSKLEEDIESIEIVANKVQNEPTPSDTSVDAFIDDIDNSTPQELDKGILTVCDRLAENGTISALQYKNYVTLANKYKTIIAPDGKTTLDNFIKIPADTLKLEKSPTIKDIKTVPDKSMLSSSLMEFDKRYIKEVLHKDVASMVLNVQNAGIVVTEYDVERVEEVMGAYDIYTIRVSPVEGANSTFRFKLPVINDDGVWVSNAIKYRMRKQIGQLPICKISPEAVALTSYYGKVFVRRSSKKTNDYGQWIRNNVMAYGLDDENKIITKLYPSNVFDNLFKAPRLFSTLAMGFRAFEFNPAGFNQGTFYVNLDHTKRMETYGKDVLKKYEKDGSVVFGTNETMTSYLVMDKNSSIYYTDEAGSLVDMGPIEHLLNLPVDKAPIDYVDLRVMGQNIPLGIILGYELGLDKLMRLLNVTPRRVPVGTRVNLDVSEYALVFNDETLVFSRDDQQAAMLLAGFNEYHRAIKNYSVYDFDKRGVYLNVLETNKIGVRYLREIDLMYQMFIDPITRDLLIEMNEPVTFRGLLMRSCEMLINDYHPDELDPAFMRHKGYERIAGAVYSEIVKSIRAHNGRVGKSKQPIDLNPYAVWKNISQDPSIALVSDINPIENLKQVEAVTFNGTGGRNSRSMTKKTRLYHPNSMGTISEATVDSSDVAINVFTSADPQYTSLRGMSKRYEIGKTGATALLSTSALMSPASDRDDPKRVIWR